jgi:catechol 2,3-dioxygenase-like lactoylglutathione lyase family enzyme
MPVEVLGIDHVRVLVGVLGYRKNDSTIGGDPHHHYYNRQFGFSIRPARAQTAHDPYAAGLHHFCFRVADEAAVDQAARELRAAGVDASAPRYYPEYDRDYYATFFTAPDGVRLEITNFRASRRRRMTAWNDLG